MIYRLCVSRISHDRSSHEVSQVLLSTPSVFYHEAGIYTPYKAASASKWNSDGDGIGSPASVPEAPR
jgi:hypothetical protein